ncbi:MAG: hypothetical protein AAF547_25600, partial [Actinomycetota bacterium]
MSLAVLVSGCGDDQPDLIAAAAGSASESTEQLAGSTEPSEPAQSRPDPVADGDPSIATTTNPTTSTVAVAPPANGDEGSDTVDPTTLDPTTSDPTTSNPEPFWDVEFLGISMTGAGEYVRLSEEADPDAECAPGWLGYLLDGEIHRYEELGPLGHMRLFNGPRGQDALVVSCEETTESVLIQGSAVTPADGIPRLMRFDLGQPHLMDFDADFGWRGDLFGGYAWHGGWTELVYFDTGTGFVSDAWSMLGTRVDRLDFGYDVVVPEDWSTEPEIYGPLREGSLVMAPPDAGSSVSITPIEFAGDPEFPDGAELVDSWTETAHLWEYVSADRATIVGNQSSLNWRLDHNGGS